MLHQTIQQLYLAALAGPAADYPVQAWALLRRQVPFAQAAWQRVSTSGEKMELSQIDTGGGATSDRRSLSLERAGFRHVFSFQRCAPEGVFSETELANLGVLCEHAVCALHINHQVMLGLSAQRDTQREQEQIGQAMVSAEGSLVTADAAFLAYISARQPDWDQSRLPFALAGDPRLPVQGMIWQGLFIRFEPVGSDYQLRVRLDRRAPVLSPREFEIAERIARGMTFKEVAREMEIAPSTVSTHLYKLYEKIGIRRRADLQVWLQRNRA